MFEHWASPDGLVYNTGHESTKRKKLRVETIKKTVKGKVYTSVLLRCSFRKDGGKSNRRRWAISPNCRPM